MRFLVRAVAVLALATLLSGCTTVFGRQYEYEEQWTLSTDGSAVVLIDASLPALVALRGLPFNPSPSALLEASMVRRVFEQAGCNVASVGQPWRRAGRRFVQVRIVVDDVLKAGTCGVLAWSSYTFNRTASAIQYSQIVGASAGGNPGTPNWNGSELVAIKLHLPSRITYHNVVLLDSDAKGDIERGNILTWEEHLADRLAGKPIAVDVKMDPESILYRTLWLFAGAFVAAMLVLTLIVWWVIRKGRAMHART